MLFPRCLGLFNENSSLKRKIVLFSIVYQHEFAPEYSDCETLEAGSDPHVRRVIV